MSVVSSQCRFIYDNSSFHGRNVTDRYMPLNYEFCFEYFQRKYAIES